MQKNSVTEIKQRRNRCEHGRGSFCFFFLIFVRKCEGKETQRLWRRLENAVQIEGTKTCVLIYRLESSGFG